MYIPWTATALTAASVSERTVFFPMNADVDISKYTYEDNNIDYRWSFSFTPMVQNKVN